MKYRDILMKKKFLAIIIILLLLVGCNKKEEEKIDVAMSVSEISTARGVKVTEDILNSLSELELTVEWESAERSLPKQCEDIETLLELAPDYLIVVPVKSIGLGEVLKKAQNIGTKVVIADRDIDEQEFENYFCKIVTDAKWEGEQAAELLAISMQNQTGVILELQAEEGASMSNQRAIGFREKLCEYPNIQIAGVISGDADRIKTQQGIQDYLEMGGSFDAVFAQSDEEGMGTLAALQENEEIPIVVIGGQQDSRKALKAELYFACIESTPYFGNLIGQAIIDDKNGKSVQKEEKMRGNIYTQENVAEMPEY